MKRMNLSFITAYSTEWHPRQNQQISRLRRNNQYRECLALSFFMPMVENKFNDKIFERLDVFDKIIRMIESCENITQLTVCRNYYNQYKEWYFISVENEMKFERNFDEKQEALIKERTKLENNE